MSEPGVKMVVTSSTATPTARQRALAYAAGPVRVRVPAGTPHMHLDWEAARLTLEARARRLRVPELNLSETEAFEEAKRLDPLAAELYMPSLETLRKRYAWISPRVAEAKSVNELLAEAVKGLVAQRAGCTFHDEYRRLLNDDHGLKESVFREKYPGSGR